MIPIQRILYIDWSSAILCTDNIINVDATDLYYNVSDKYIYFEDGYAPFVYWYSTDTSIINNEFYYNPYRFWLPYGYIYYHQNNGMNCLSGNIFTNHAIFADSTDITSCFRKGLIDCILYSFNTM